MKHYITIALWSLAFGAFLAAAMVNESIVEIVEPFGAFIRWVIQ